MEDELVVEREPPEGTLFETLQAVLEPHGLAVEVGPAATLLVVRRRARVPLRIELEHPREDTVAAGDVAVEARVWGDEPVRLVEISIDGRVVARLEDPPYRTMVSLDDGAPARTFEAVAVGTQGGRAASSVTTRRLELREELDVALKQIYVTATTRGGRPVVLSREHVRIYDEGRQRPVVTFERGDLPLTAVALVDASESMRGSRLDAASRGLHAFAAAMQPLDEATVLLFADRPVRWVPFDSAPVELLAGLGEIAARGGTSLHDALYVALRTLDHRLGRKVVILLSDGADVSSVLSMQDVLWKLQRTDAQLYWIRLRTAGDRAQDTISSSWRDAATHQEESRLLQQAITESGGRIEVLQHAEEGEAAVRSILAELRGQYALGYYPEDRRFDGSWRPVEVRVGVPGVDLRYRSGYIDR